MAMLELEFLYNVFHSKNMKDNGNFSNWFMWFNPKKNFIMFFINIFFFIISYLLYCCIQLKIFNALVVMSETKVRVHKLSKNYCIFVNSSIRYYIYRNTHTNTLTHTHIQTTHTYKQYIFNGNIISISI